jgi:putative transposase
LQPADGNKRFKEFRRIFIRRPSGNFVNARYADVTLPAITLHEAVTARRALLAKGRRKVDPRAIARTAIAQRELVETAATRWGKATASGSR